MKLTCSSVVFVCALTYSWSALAQATVSHPGAGIQLTPPVGWHAATLAQVQANREGVRLADPEFERALATRSALPLIVYMKYPERYPDLNPTVQVTLRSALQGSPTSLLTTALAPMRRAFPKFRVVTPVQQTTVSGWPAATVTVTYTLTDRGGATFPVRSRMWVVPRGNLMFLIGMSGSTTGENLCEEEFRDVLTSIRIDK
jgi:hypothetical protein